MLRACLQGTLLDELWLTSAKLLSESTMIVVHSDESSYVGNLDSANGNSPVVNVSIKHYEVKLQSR